MSTEAESLIQLIIGDVVQECAVRGHGVSAALAAFMVKAVVLDPRNGFNVDRRLTRQDVDKLEELCLDKLLKKCSPTLDTIKMQLYFERNYTCRREVLEAVQQDLQSRLSAVRSRITEARVKTRDQLQTVYQDLVSYILLHSGLGSASDPGTVQEATAALQSVFPLGKLGVFMVLSKKEKEEQLEELSLTATGIRLFNRACREGQEGFRLHHLMVEDPLTITPENVESVLRGTQSLSWRYTAVLEKLSNLDSEPALYSVPGLDLVAGPGEVPELDSVPGPGEVAGLDLVPGPGEVPGLDSVPGPGEVAGLDSVPGPGEVPGLDSVPGPGEVPVGLLKQALYNVRQHQHFLTLLQADAHVCVRHIDVLKAELSSHMEQLKQAVQSKTAVPTTLVFPLFKNMSKLWGRLRDEVELLSILNNLNINLQPFLASQAKIFSADYLDRLLGAAEVKTDEQRMSETSDQRVDPAEVEMHEWLWPSGPADFNELPLEYNGFCGYTLAVDDLLLPGNPNIGVLNHKEKLYVFSSREAASKFAAKADDFVSEVTEKAKRAPELIQLLQLQQQFPVASVSSEPGERLQVTSITKRDGCAQTDVHPIETNIDKSYEWNEWELRRKALKLADLRTKATVSTQTDRSHMRRDNNSQTWNLKDAACVTERVGQSSMPTPQVYLAGLRGRRDAQAVTTNLTSSFTSVDQKY